MSSAISLFACAVSGHTGQMLTESLQLKLPTLIPELSYLCEQDTNLACKRLAKIVEVSNRICVSPPVSVLYENKGDLTWEERHCSFGDLCWMTWWKALRLGCNTAVLARGLAVINWNLYCNTRGNPSTKTRTTGYRSPSMFQMGFTEMSSTLTTTRSFGDDLADGLSVIPVVFLKFNST